MRRLACSFLLALFWVWCLPMSVSSAMPRQKANDAWARKDYNTAEKLYRPLAKQGDTEAQLRLGMLHEAGRGVRVDYGEAAAWYGRAAQQGNARAQTNLGFLYECGRGVRKNYAQALLWYQKAAAQGYARAQNNLGVLYLHGKGVRSNHQEARRWFTLASQQGLKQASANLAALEGKTSAKTALLPPVPPTPPLATQRSRNELVAERLRPLPVEKQEQVLLGDVLLLAGMREQTDVKKAPWNMLLSRLDRRTLQQSVQGLFAETALDAWEDHCERYGVAAEKGGMAEILACYTAEPKESLLFLRLGLPPSPKKATRISAFKDATVLLYGPHQRMEKQRTPTRYTWNMPDVIVSVAQECPNDMLYLMYAVTPSSGPQTQDGVSKEQHAALFGVPLHTATRATLRQALSEWKAHLFAPEEKRASSSSEDRRYGPSMRAPVDPRSVPPALPADGGLCDYYASSRLLPGSSELAVCYTPHERAAHLTYAFYPAVLSETPGIPLFMALKKQLSTKYGEPRGCSGLPDYGPLHCTWDHADVRIILYRSWPDQSVFLRYVLPSRESELPLRLPMRFRGEGDVF